MSSLRRSNPDELAKGPQFVGNNIVHPTAKIGKDCKIGPNVSIGIGCEIGDGVRITGSVLLHRVKARLSHIHPCVAHSPLLLCHMVPSLVADLEARWTEDLAWHSVARV